MQTRIFTLSSFDPGICRQAAGFRAADTWLSAFGFGDYQNRRGPIQIESVVTTETAEYK